MNIWNRDGPCNNNTIIISRVETGTEVVISDKEDNIKMVVILNDTAKFKIIGSVDDFHKSA